MVRHGGSSAGSYLADPTSPIPSHCASIIATSTLRVNAKYHWAIVVNEMVAVTEWKPSLNWTETVTGRQMFGNCHSMEIARVTGQKLDITVWKYQKLSCCGNYHCKESFFSITLC